MVAVGSHDTASAVVGRAGRAAGTFAYVSSGTWSLVGLELDEPVLTDASRAANFTNEGGVDGRVRYLRNVRAGCGCCRSRCGRGGRPGTTRTRTLCSPRPRACRPAVRPSTSTTPTSSRRGTCPAGSGPRCEASGQQPPASAGAVVRCILDSLAVAYARTVEEAEGLSDRTVRGDPRRRRRLPERAALPADGGSIRPAGPRRSGGGDRAGQSGRAGTSRRSVWARHWRTSGMLFGGRSRLIRYEPRTTTVREFEEAQRG